MKKGDFILILGIFFLVSLVSANQIESKYEIFDTTVLVTINSQEGNFDLKVPYDSKVIESNVNYSLEERILKIGSGEDVLIQYNTKSYLDKAGKEIFFTLAHPIKNSSIILYLPEEGILTEEKIVLPEANEIETDGRRIFLVWNNFSEDQLVVSYDLIPDEDFHYWAIIFVLFLGIVGIYYYSDLKHKEELKKIKRKQIKNKEKIEEKITRNLYDEEREIVKFLLKKKGNESWTKEIIRELGINKVKLSRKLRSLESRGIVQRIPHGSENRIKLIQKK